MQASRKAQIVFWRVFAKIPQSDQNRILEYWQSLGVNQPSIYECTEQQMIAVGCRPDSIAVTLGSEFYFRTELVSDAPDDVLNAIIAHELAHSLNGFDQEYSVINEIAQSILDRVNRHPVDKTAKREALDYRRFEDAANQAAVKWGFKIAEAVEWCENRFS